MLNISERITRVTALSGAVASLWPEAAARSQIASVPRATTGARVTLEFSSSVPLSPGEAVCLRYDLAGDGRLQECAGVAQLTHTVARRGHLVVFHYRLSHWVTASTLPPIREMKTCG